MAPALSERPHGLATITFETLPDLGLSTEVDVAAPYAELAHGLLDDIEAAGTTPDAVDVLALYGLMGAIELTMGNLDPASEDATLFAKQIHSVTDRVQELGFLTGAFAEIERVCYDPSLTSASDAI